MSLFVCAATSRLSKLTATLEKSLLAGFMAGGFALALTSLAGGPALAEANGKAARQRAAADLVAEALQREIYAQGEDRDALLLRAVQASPDLAQVNSRVDWR